ncbi:MAG: substrate-binding domain-containing protein [Alphaproteobacteria bacterium]|nr:substrate-binding domain-containing protein [Alphaproteobacteria bacterium]
MQEPTSTSDCGAWARWVRPPFGAEEGDRPYRSAADRFRVGLYIPLSGPPGLWGPSSQACAVLAAAELNQIGGIAGRDVELLTVDAADAPAQVAEETERLIDEAGLDAIVGMHDSQVRHAVSHATAGRIPYVYTPLYEGGEQAPGVYAIGETPELQLRPAIAHLLRTRGLRRWCFIGNDYVWPRVSHRAAAKYVTGMGGEIADDIYVPFGIESMDDILDRVARAAPDVLLLSLVGGDAITFNRAFGTTGLDRWIARFSAIVDENVLLGSGAANTRNLFVASGYFCALETPANRAFKERYMEAFDGRAPVLNAMGESVYEGLRFLAALESVEIDRRGPGRAPAPLRYGGPRQAVFYNNARRRMPMYLAKADGYDFRVLASL